MSPGSSSIEVGRASRKVMHEGAVRVMAEGAGGRTLLVRGGTACGGVVMAPVDKTPKTKGRRRQVKGVYGVLPDRGHHADQIPWQRICDEGHSADENSLLGRATGGVTRAEIPTWSGMTRTTVTTYQAQTRRAGTHWQ